MLSPPRFRRIDVINFTKACYNLPVTREGNALRNNEIKPYPQPTQFVISEKNYRLARPFVYKWECEGIDYRIVVPKDFEYDGASVPRIAWSLIGLRPSGLISAASCVHDMMYQRGGRLRSNYEKLDSNRLWQVVNARWTRLAADRLFGRMLREAGISRTKRVLAYKAVRWFGGGNYNQR